MLCWLIPLQLTCLDFSEMKQDATGLIFFHYAFATGEQREQEGTRVFVMGILVHILLHLLKLLVKTGLC